MANRDFCLLKAKYYIDKEGNISTTPFEGDPSRYVAVAVSTEHEDCPPVKKVVRADLILGGWECEPHPEDPNKTLGIVHQTLTS